MSDTQGSSSNDGSSPPSDGNQTPSEDSSPSGSNSPESPDSAGNPSPDSPPSDSNNTPPSDSAGNPSPDSPPSDSNNTPPSDSGNSPDTNTPSSPSDSSSSPPSPPPPKESDSSPPPDSKGGDSPRPPKESDSSSPSDSNNDGNSTPPPPPPSDNKNTPSDSPPTPKSSKDSPPKSDKGNKSSPPSSDNQNSPNTDNPSPPPRGGTQSNNSHVPEPSGPSTHSNRNSISDAASSSRSSSGSGGTIDTGTVAGATVAGVLIIAFIALFFVIARKRKSRPLDHYDRTQPPNYTGNSEGHYYGGTHSQQHLQTHSQQHLIGMPGGHSQEYYSGGRPPAYPNSGPMNSYGSYKGPDSGTLGGAQLSFTYDELMGITQGFSRQNVIGEGGFGAVYKGHLPDGRIVAVKQLKAGSGQGEREFRAEVEINSRVHHRHLVSLVGYCIADAQRLLVYEFVPNNTLEHHIHTQGVPVLDWSKRVKIAIGAARGLAYLHEDCHPKIIHRDIKSANILLDDVYEAQVADFGLAKLSNDITTHVSTRVMGTFGYMAPEYASSGKLTDRSDVFSFGVVLLELVTGRRPIEANEDESLVEWARPLIANAIETGDFSELVDPRLEKRYVESEMFRMAETAAACVRHSATKRPRMVQVLRALDTDSEMPDINNGVKVGQSTIFETNSDLQKFRMLALGGNDSADYSVYGGSMNSRAEILPPKPPPGWRDESETRAINPRKW